MRNVLGKIKNARRGISKRCMIPGNAIVDKVRSRVPYNCIMPPVKDEPREESESPLRDLQDRVPGAGAAPGPGPGGSHGEDPGTGKPSTRDRMQR